MCACTSENELHPQLAFLENDEPRGLGMPYFQTKPYYTGIGAAKHRQDTLQPLQPLQPRKKKTDHCRYLQVGHTNMTCQSSCWFTAESTSRWGMVSEVAAYQAIREKWHPKVGQYLELGICTDFRSAQFILCLTTSVEKLALFHWGQSSKPTAYGKVLKGKNCPWHVRANHMVNRTNKCE